MKRYTVLLLLIAIQSSLQVQPNCTYFGLPTPCETDLRSIAWEVQKAMRTVPLLADYSSSQNGQTAAEEDLMRYTEGMNNQDARLTIAQIVEKYGYNFEQHSVRTDDGYYLTLHRIPNSGNKVVFINHGLFGSSADWLMAEKDSLPFILASLGYDVWLGNFRGNRYSYKHVSLLPECAQYWDFSFDEIGCYDLPASIDYITWKTGQEKLTFIGYSLSTTAFFVMTSLLPAYNNKISLMIALSPMAYGTNMKSPIMRLIASNEDLERKFKSAIGPFEFRPSDLLTNSMRRVVCDDNIMSPILCSSLPFLITGFNYKLLNMNNFYTISQHYAAGGSTRTLLHYSQNINSGLFRRYDYPHVIKNIDKYDSINPVNYPVENIEAKVSFIMSTNDYLSNVTDVQELSKRLPNVGDVIFLPDYSAVDYLWAYDVKVKVYDTIVALIQKCPS